MGLRRGLLLWGSISTQLMESTCRPQPHCQSQQSLQRHFRYVRPGSHVVLCLGSPVSSQMQQGQGALGREQEKCNITVIGTDFATQCGALLGWDWTGECASQIPPRPNGM